MRIAGRARASKVKPDDVDGSTFSTPNVGICEMENFIAIVSPPEVAILAVGSAKQTPVVVAIEIGWRMKATVYVVIELAMRQRSRAVHETVGEVLGNARADVGVKKQTSEVKWLRKFLFRYLISESVFHLSTKQVSSHHCS